jgi:hypothetical protein
MTKLSAAKMRALEAVKAGKVRHMHPFAWVVADWTIKDRTLQVLARDRLIKVVSTRDVQRPVILTEEGRVAIFRLIQPPE